MLILVLLNQAFSEKPSMKLIVFCTNVSSSETENCPVNVINRRNINKIIYLHISAYKYFRKCIGTTTYSVTINNS